MARSDMEAFENMAQSRQPGAEHGLCRTDCMQAFDIKPESRADPASGTALANIDINTGGVSFYAKAGVAGWGGARNRASRTSDGVTLAQCENIIAAARYADAIGLSLNRHVIIHWQAAGIPDSEAAWATGRFLKLAGDWTAKRGGRIAWAWVRENGDGKGSHVHILLHVPAGREPWRMVRAWLRSITGKRYRQGSIKTARIGGTTRAWQTLPALYRENLAAVVGYVLKGASPAAIRALGLERIEPGGRIIGKRVSTSQNIGRAARRGCNRCFGPTLNGCG